MRKKHVEKSDSKKPAQQHSDAELACAFRRAMNPDLGTAETLWRQVSERAFLEGDGRLFLHLPKPEGSVSKMELALTFATVMHTQVSEQPNLTHVYTRFSEGNMPEGGVFVVIDLCTGKFEDVLLHTGKSALSGKQGAAIDAGELAYKFIPRMQKAVKQKVEGFRVPEHLLWCMSTGTTLDPDQIASVEALMQHDDTAAARFAKIKEAATAVAKRGSRPSRR